jgi:hypothetical protein
MRLRHVLLGCSLPLLLAREAPAQSGRPAVSVVLGTVVDEAGAPLQGVGVFALGRSVSAQSAERGQFQMPMLASGNYRMVARRAGYRPDTVDVELAPDDSVALWIVLKRLAVELRGVVVDAEYVAPRLTAFEQHRLHTIGGRFITPADIQAQAPTETSDLLRRIPGVRIADSSHVMVPISNRGYKLVDIAGHLVAAQCIMRLGLNGFLQSPTFSMNMVSPNDIHGIEIYNGPASIPPEYNAGAVDMHCGLIMIWTRSGR